MFESFHANPGTSQRSSRLCVQKRNALIARFLSKKERQNTAAKRLPCDKAEI
jgi:hypothetical protein